MALLYLHYSFKEEVMELNRIAVFYDGSFFHHVNQYYAFTPEVV
jgi:hypothetical protein